MITLKQIHYILAVEKTLHFKQAAELCSVSQSALSSAIGEMEKQLGFQIFERDNKRVLVTPLGKQCLTKARQIKLQVDDLYQIGLAQREPLSYPLTIGTIPTIAPYLLPKILPEVRRRYPGLQLRLVEEQSHLLVEMVKQGEIDSAILALPYDLEGLLAFEFWQEDFYWIAHRQDAEQMPKRITGKQLKGSRLMLLKEGHCLKDHALAACRLPASVTDSTMASTSLNTLIQMVAGRMGSTLVPEMALDQLLSGYPELVSQHLDEPGPHRRLAFILRPNYAGLENIETLKQIIVDQLKQMAREGQAQTTE